jgi:hypothetical protein
LIAAKRNSTIRNRRIAMMTRVAVTRGSYACAP